MDRRRHADDNNNKKVSTRRSKARRDHSPEGTNKRRFIKTLPHLVVQMS